MLALWPPARLSLLPSCMCSLLKQQVNSNQLSAMALTCVDYSGPLLGWRGVGNVGVLLTLFSFTLAVVVRPNNDRWLHDVEQVESVDLPRVPVLSISSL